MSENLAKIQSRPLFGQWAISENVLSGCVTYNEKVNLLQLDLETANIEGLVNITELKAKTSYGETTVGFMGNHYARKSEASDRQLYYPTYIINQTTNPVELYEKPTLIFQFNNPLTDGIETDFVDGGELIKDRITESSKVSIENLGDVSIARGLNYEKHSQPAGLTVKAENLIVTFELSMSCIPIINDVLEIFHKTQDLLRFITGTHVGVTKITFGYDTEEKELLMPSLLSRELRSHDFVFTEFKACESIFNSSVKRYFEHYEKSKYKDAIKNISTYYSDALMLVPDSIQLARLFGALDVVAKILNKSGIEKSEEEKREEKKRAGDYATVLEKISNMGVDDKIKTFLKRKKSEYISPDGQKKQIITVAELLKHNNILSSMFLNKEHVDSIWALRSKLMHGDYLDSTSVTVRSFYGEPRYRTEIEELIRAFLLYSMSYDNEIAAKYKMFRNDLLIALR